MAALAPKGPKAHLHGWNYEGGTMVVATAEDNSSERRWVSPCFGYARLYFGFHTLLFIVRVLGRHVVPRLLGLVKAALDDCRHRGNITPPPPPNAAAALCFNVDLSFFPALWRFQRVNFPTFPRCHLPLGFR